MRSAELKPDLPAFMFPPPSKVSQQQQPTSPRPNSRVHENWLEEQEGSAAHTSPLTMEGDEYGDDDLNDQDMVDAGEPV